MNSNKVNVFARSEATKQSPNDLEDCFARKKHSLAMTL